MAEPSTHTNYSFEDIQRYLQGDMSAAEMHAIEKAALRDPFLADAIEGFNEVDPATARHHLNEINAGLFREKQRSKIITFNNKTRWLNIAAMVLILAGVGVLGVYLLRNSDSHQQVAQAKNDAANKTALKDSVTTLNASPLNASPEMKKEEPVVAQNQTKSAKLKRSVTAKKDVSGQLTSIDSDKQTDEANVAAISALPVQQDEPVARSVAPVAAPSAQQNRDSSQTIVYNKTMGLNAESRSFRGKITDERNQPIPGVLVESADKKAAVRTDANGKFNLNKNDSSLLVTASTIGYYSKQINLRAGDNQAIALKQKNLNLAGDVLITPDNQAAMPVGGWENFNRYVLSQLNKDSTSENDVSPGNVVELEFGIDKSGDPQDIKIIKSLDQQRDAKAINILKKGPKWINPSGNQMAKVVIKF